MIIIALNKNHLLIVRQLCNLRKEKKLHFMAVNRIEFSNETIYHSVDGDIDVVVLVLWLWVHKWHGHKNNMKTWVYSTYSDSP